MSLAAGAGNSAISRLLRPPANPSMLMRDHETRTELAAALRACDEASDLAPTIAALEAIPAAEQRRTNEHEVTIGGAAHRVAGSDVGYLLRQARRRHGQFGSGEWDPRSRVTPRPGHTFRGYRIGEQRSIEGTPLKLVRRAGRWGCIYMGDYSPFRAAADRAATRFEQQGQPYRAAAARGVSVMHEGGVGAINTYDGMVFTLGPGYAGGRLARVLQSLQGTPAGNAIGQVSYLSGLQFNGDENVRLDIPALVRIIDIVERQFPVDFAEAWLLDVVERDGLAGGSGAEAAGNRAAAQTIPEVIGVAQYLHHGYSVYAPRPARDVEAAVRLHPGNPSAQVAAITKFYAQRVAADRTEDPAHYRSRVPSIIRARIPHKIHFFISAARRRDPSFRFDEQAARAEVPCLRPDGPFAHTTSAPSGVYLDVTSDEGERRFYDFGAPI